MKLHRKIVATFNYNPYRDFLAGIELNDLIKSDLWDKLPRESVVSVIGPSNPSNDPEGYVIVADSALRYYSGRYDMIVSDLDGPIEKIIDSKDCIKVIHAHGDNIEKLRKYVPEMSGTVLGTTQSIPLQKVKNIGGFTDGDRSVIMGILMGAEKIYIYGFDYSKPVDEPANIKLKKMLFGKEIIENKKGPVIEYLTK